MEVTLEPVDRDNVQALCALRTKPGQDRFVAPNAVTLAEAHHYPGSLVRGIYADGEPVGVLWVAREQPQDPPFLVRLSIAGDHQRRGIGRRAMALLLDELRAAGETELELSFVPAEDGPQGFYERLGFSDTGRTLEDERVWRRDL
jgi:diamine N-acetyltransferase